MRALEFATKTERGRRPLLHMPFRSRGLRMLTERFKELHLLEKSAADVAVKDAKFEILLKHPKEGSKLLSHLRLVFNVPTLTIAAALAALAAYKRQKTGCFRYEFDLSTGRVLSTCKVAECSCEGGGGGGGIGTTSMVTVCGPELLTATQRLVSRVSDCPEDGTGSSCIACDITAGPMSGNHLPIDEVPSGVRYQCETPSLLDVYGDLVGQSVAGVARQMNSTVHYFGVTLKWVLALVPIVGFVVFLVMAKRSVSTLSWVMHEDTDDQSERLPLLKEPADAGVTMTGKMKTK